jgi:hypothetical protein
VADLVGITSDDPIDSVAAMVSEALGVTLRPRESSYWGDPYYSGWPESAIKLTANLDPMYREGDPVEDRWFSATAPEVVYLLWETDDPPAVAIALGAVGLNAAVVQQT